MGDMKDVDIDVNLTTKGPEAVILKEMLRKGDGAKAIREKLKNYVDALKVEFGANVILPAKDSIPAPKTKTVVNVQQNSVSVNKSDETKQMKNLGINDGCKMEVKDIELVETFKCTGQELYNALTQKEMMQVFTGGQQSDGSPARAR